MTGRAPAPDHPIPAWTPGRAVAGVDGCPAGWIAVYRWPGTDRPPEAKVHARFTEILADGNDPAVVGVDMPIGLPDRSGPGGRGPERLVRAFLGERQSSVFTVPSRAAVEAGIGLPDDAGYAAACRIAAETSEPPRRVSKQCFYLFPKIREIDALFGEQDLAGRVFEVHPEVAFWRLNGERAMPLPKKVKSRPNPPGLAERVDLLVRHGLPRALLEGPRPRGVGPDDLLDAAVVSLIAERIARSEATPFPNPPGRDERGRPIAIWA
jgi:predicted RNase H-like nuclease